MNDTVFREGSLHLPRDDDGLATSRSATRRLQEILPAFLATAATDASADGLVVTLDGTVEATVTAAMAVDAIGSDHVISLGLPTNLVDTAAAHHAETVASMLETDHYQFQLYPLLIEFQNVVGDVDVQGSDLMAIQNAIERFCMTCVYYMANTTTSLVVGSVPRTNLLLGTVTKYGETGVDVAPLGDLYRTEVAALASDHEVPEPIEAAPGRVRPPDHERLEVDERTLDVILRLRVDEELGPSAVARQLDVDLSIVRTVDDWRVATRHKRRPPRRPSTSH